MKLENSVHPSPIMDYIAKTLEQISGLLERSKDRSFNVFLWFCSYEAGDSRNNL